MMRAEIYESEIYQQRTNPSQPDGCCQRLWLSGLTYQCDFIQERYTWEEAKAYLKALSQTTGQQWRLPTLKELERLLSPVALANLRQERHHMIKTFLDFMPQESIFWSSTQENSMGVWVVDFSQGYYTVRDKSNHYYLLYVSDSKLV